MYLNDKADTRCFENQKLHEPKKNHWQKPNPCPSRVINHKGLQAQILRDSKEQRRKGKDRKIHGNRAGTLLPSTARRMRATLGSGPIQMFTEHLPTSIYEGLIPQYPEEIGMYSLSAPLQVLQRSWWAGVTGFTMIYYHLPWSSPHQLLCLLYWRRSSSVTDCSDWQGCPSNSRGVPCMPLPNSGSDQNAQSITESLPKAQTKF